MRRTIYFVLTLACIFTSMYAQSLHFTQQKICISNTDYNGTVLASIVNVASTPACALQCSLVDDCESFVFDIRVHGCVLKSLKYSGSPPTCDTNGVYGRKVFHILFHYL